MTKTILTVFFETQCNKVRKSDFCHCCVNMKKDY